MRVRHSDIWILYAAGIDDDRSDGDNDGDGVDDDGGTFHLLIHILKFN